jgi:hypothetical protein
VNEVPHSQISLCYAAVKPLSVLVLMVDREMGSTMAAADKEFSSAVLTLVDTFCLLIGLCLGSSTSKGY